MAVSKFRDSLAYTVLFFHQKKYQKAKNKLKSTDRFINELDTNSLEEYQVLDSRPFDRDTIPS